MTAGILLLAIPAVLSSWAGTWKLIPAESDDIRKSVDAAVSKMNFLIRGIARSRLTKTQVAFPSISIQHSESEFRISHHGGTNIRHANAGQPVSATAPDGSRVTVRLDPGPPLAETYESPEGKRVNTYTLSPDGRKLRLHVRVTSPRLPKPVEYSLVYTRGS